MRGVSVRLRDYKRKDIEMNKSLLVASFAVLTTSVFGMNHGHPQLNNARNNPISRLTPVSSPAIDGNIRNENRKRQRTESIDEGTYSGATSEQDSSEPRRRRREECVDQETEECVDQETEKRIDQVVSGERMTLIPLQENKQKFGQYLKGELPFNKQIELAKVILESYKEVDDDGILGNVIRRNKEIVEYKKVIRDRNRTIQNNKENFNKLLDEGEKREALIKEKDEEITQLKEEIKTYKEKKDLFEKELKKSSKENQRIQKQICELKQQNNELVQRNNEYMQNDWSQRGEINDLSTQLQNANNLSNQVKDLQDENERLKQKLEEKDKKIEGDAGEIEWLYRRLRIDTVVIKKTASSVKWLNNLLATTYHFRDLSALKVELSPEEMRIRKGIYHYLHELISKERATESISKNAYQLFKFLDAISRYRKGSTIAGLLEAQRDVCIKSSDESEKLKQKIQSLKDDLDNIKMLGLDEDLNSQGIRINLPNISEDLLRNESYETSSTKLKKELRAEEKNEDFKGYSFYTKFQKKIISQIKEIDFSRKLFEESIENRIEFIEGLKKENSVQKFIEKIRELNYFKELLKTVEEIIDKYHEADKRLPIYEYKEED